MTHAGRLPDSPFVAGARLLLFVELRRACVIGRPARGCYIRRPAPEHVAYLLRLLAPRSSKLPDLE